MFIDIRDTCSLTDFHRNSAAHVEHLKATRRPELLTINGAGALIVQDAEAYQTMVERLEMLESVEQIKQVVRELDIGKGIPMEEVLKKLEVRLAAKYPSAKI
jgi:PHD/YefM family antitoxin component YafN of YafNO toxin-antitoxin module